MQTINIFSEVKERLNLIEAAHYYGVQPNRGGFINCIFHNDKTPSMKLYADHFHCYGCGKHGDIITLTEQLFSLPPYPAAQKLSQDFFVTPIKNPERKTRLPNARQPYIEQENRTYKVLNQYCDFLKNCREIYKPSSPDDEFHPLFVESLMKYDQYDYYRDIFITGSKEDREYFINDFKEVITSLEQKLNEKTENRKG